MTKRDSIRINKLFNNEIKLEFIKHNENDIVHLINIFEKTKEFEEQNDKDVSKFNIKEITDMMSTLIPFYIGTMNSAFSFISQLRKYADYCFSNNLIEDGQNHFREISTEILAGNFDNKICSQVYITRDEILKFGFMNESDRFIILALFEGIYGKYASELINLTIYDFYENDGKYYADLKDYDNNIRTIEVSRELFVLAHSADAEEEYNSINYGTRDRIYKYQPTERGELIKSYPNVKDNSLANQSQRLKVRIGKILNNSFFSDKASALTVIDSGIIYYINQLATEYGISGEEVIVSKQGRELIQKKFNRGRVIVKSFLNKYGDLLVK